MELTELSSSKTTLNCGKSKAICLENRRCKRMTCGTCRAIKRRFFIIEGTRFAHERGLSRHLTIKWRKTSPEEAWPRVVSATSTLTRAMSGRKAGPYIRVIDLGKDERITPHVHFLVSEHTAVEIERIARKKFSEQRSVNIKNDPVYEVSGLLGYFYDKNAVPSFLDPGRFKRIRIISASRGMPCGFPKPKYPKTRMITGEDACILAT
jgi:hypothetical protein